MRQDGNQYRHQAGGSSGVRRTLVFAAALIWSLLAVAIYLAIDPILGWLGANAGNMITSGKTIATTAGVDKTMVSAIDGLDIAGISASLLNLAAWIAKPTIMVLWALGMATILAIPLITRKLGAYLGAGGRGARPY